MKTIAEQLLERGDFPSWWFNPNNPQARQPESKEIKKHLQGIDPDLRLTWNPVERIWQLWGKPDSMNRVTAERSYAEWSRGWRHLADLKDPDGKAMALTTDNIDTMCAMVLAKTYGGAQARLKGIEDKAKAARESRRRSLASDQEAWASDWWDHITKIRVGYGGNNGSKFAKYIG